MKFAKMLSMNMKCLVVGMFLWIILLVSYAISLKFHFHEAALIFSINIIALLADAIIAFCAFQTYLKITEKISKQFYGLIFISLFPCIITTQIYNVSINFIHITIEDPIKFYLLNFPYTFFLIIQIFAWTYLIAAKMSLKYIGQWRLEYSNLEIVMLLILSIFLFVVFRNINFTQINLTRTVNTLLEAMLYILITISLSRTKNQSLIYVEVGLLLQIVFNLVHRFSYLAVPYYQMFDLIQLGYYLLILYGFLLASQEKDKPIEFFSKNSLYTIISVLFSLFSALLFIIFLSLGVISSFIDNNYISIFSLYSNSIPMLFIFSLLLSTIIGKIGAYYFSRPLEVIKHRINLMSTDGLSHEKFVESSIKLDELATLDKFIIKTMHELQLANQVKSDFLRNMSHDFRTPASGIYCISKSIHKRLENAELKKLQKLIIDSSHQLLNLFDSILDYSRLANNQYKPRHEDIDIIVIIQEVVQFVSAMIHEKKLQLNTTIPSPASYCYGDRTMLYRVILNIVTNAIKFTQEGNISIFVEDNSPWVIITIKDTGIGIDEKHHQLIFEPFARMNSVDTAQYSGIGLGLSTALAMLNKMGGTIAVESQLGHGSSFNIYIPMAEKERNY